MNSNFNCYRTSAQLPAISNNKALGKSNCNSPLKAFSTTDRAKLNKRPHQKSLKRWNVPKLQIANCCLINHDDFMVCCHLIHYDASIFSVNSIRWWNLYIIRAYKSQFVRLLLSHHPRRNLIYREFGAPFTVMELVQWNIIRIRESWIGSLLIQFEFSHSLTWFIVVLCG